MIQAVTILFTGIKTTFYNIYYIFSDWFLAYFNLSINRKASFVFLSRDFLLAFCRFCLNVTDVILTIQCITSQFEYYITKFIIYAFNIKQLIFIIITYYYNKDYILYNTLFKLYISLGTIFYLSYFLSDIYNYSMSEIFQLMLFFWSLSWFTYLTFINTSFMDNYSIIYLILSIFLLIVMLYTLPILVKFMRIVYKMFIDKVYTRNSNNNGEGSSSSSGNPTESGPSGSPSGGTGGEGPNNNPSPKDPDYNSGNPSSKKSKKIYKSKSRTPEYRRKKRAERKKRLEEERILEEELRKELEKQNRIEEINEANKMHKREVRAAMTEEDKAIENEYQGILRKEKILENTEDRNKQLREMSKKRVDNWKKKEGNLERSRLIKRKSAYKKKILAEAEKSGEVLNEQEITDRINEREQLFQSTKKS